MNAQVFDLKGNRLAGLGETPSGFSQLLERYNKPGPRYTSYPTIDQCGELIDPRVYEQALQGRALGGLQRPLSLYVHIPFCESICYYCACNKVITRKRDRVREYLDALVKEADWVVQKCNSLTPVVQFHIGGGTPTFLNDDELTELIRSLEAMFVFSPIAERSIEVDPRTVTEQRLKHLHELGFNRISFGVQDFDARVQKAVHREQTYESIQALMKATKTIGFKSINIDLIYGLPLQTAASFESTLEKLLEVNPDRVALYSYAHLPERFKPQRRIHATDLPDSKEKISILQTAIHFMTMAGYEYIGMDHFAKPKDSLAIARRKGALHRNFQGYTTLPEADLIGLGVSAISRVGPTLLQNTRDLDEYAYLVKSRGNATFRGHVSDRDDLIRYSVIMAILCQGEVNWSDFLHSHWIDFSEYFKDELIQLRTMQEEGLVEINEQSCKLTDLGWYFVRPIAMLFDRYLQRKQIDRSQVL